MYLRIAIAVLSAGAIAYEILLIRIVSIIQWHHFAAMIISLALLGYGMSGTVLTSMEGWLSSGTPDRWQRTFVACCLLFGLTSVACAVLAQRLPFNPLALVWDLHQFFSLLAVYLLLTIPFFCAAMAIGLALMSKPQRIGSLYGADLVGAGLGAAGLLVALFMMPMVACLRVIGILGCLAAGVFALGRPRTMAMRKTVFLVAAVLVLNLAWPRSWLEPRLSEYKSLHKTMLIPGAEVVAERSGPLGWLTLVGNSNVPFRHAPGLSLNFEGRLPEQLGLFTDGDSMTVLNLVQPGDGKVGYLDFLPAAVGYRLAADPAVLILGAAGGSEIQMALQQRAARVDVVEANSQVIELLSYSGQDGVGGLLPHVDVNVNHIDPRSFLRRNRSLYDVIQVPLAQSLASASSGSQALGANHLLTVESFVESLNSLRPDGALVLSLWLKIPPRENLRLVATLAQALEEIGVAEPGRHLVQIRGWGTVTTMAKRSPLQAREIAAIRQFCQERSFDVSLLPGLTEESSNLNNRLQKAYLFRGNRRILRDPQTFFANYKFDVRPATDNRPFFFHTFKWQTLPELLRLGSRAGVPLVEWGYVALVATVIQALTASVVLILIPLRLVRRQATTRASLTVLIFFASLGLGFMLVEIAFFQRFTLYLGHPTFSVAVVLAAFLVAAGLGAVCSRRLLDRPGSARLSPRIFTLAVLVLGSIWWLALPSLMGATIALPVGLKLGLTFAMLAPLGFLLGIPFPLGLSRAAARQSIWLPWAWGINGSAAVVGAALAPVIAVHLGFSAVLLAGLSCYALASFCTSWSPLSTGANGS